MTRVSDTRSRSTGCCHSWTAVVSVTINTDTHTHTHPYNGHFFTGQMPFLSPNQQRQRTEGNSNSLFQSTHKTFLLCKSLPPQPSFSSSGLTPRIPRGLFTDTSEHIRFLHFSFSAFHFVVVCYMWLIKLTKPSQSGISFSNATTNQ